MNIDLHVFPVETGGSVISGDQCRSVSVLLTAVFVEKMLYKYIKHFDVFSSLDVTNILKNKISGKLDLENYRL